MEKSEAGINLNDEQKKAAAAPPGPLIIVAGAGTGKTRTLTCRLAHLIEQGMPPEKICAITFTNKAAKEMADRVLSFRFSIFPPKADPRAADNFQKPFIGTFHSLGAKILREEAAKLGRTKRFAIFDGDDSFSLVKKIVKKNFPKRRGEESAKDKTARLRDKKSSPAHFSKKISEAKSTGAFSAKQPREHGANDEKAEKILREYEDALRENNAFDFDDLIAKPVLLFEKHPDVLRGHQKKFGALLVDEYQDLNPMQYEFVRLLAGEHKNLSVVGDDEQMIYGWRHADIKIFLNFDRDWAGAGAVFLEENYRSTANIIGAAAAISKNNVWRTPKNLWTQNPPGEPISLFEAGDEEREADFIAQAISRDAKPQIRASDANSNLEHSDELAVSNRAHGAAVLYRTNAQSRAIEQALIRRQIPYKIFGGVRFYERKEIKDVIAALRWAWNRKDAISRERLEKLLSRARFSEFALKINDIKNFKPANIMEVFLKTTDYMDYLERNFLNHGERQENIAELVNFAKNYENPEVFLEEAALAQPLDESRAKRQASGPDNPADRLPSVNLMTIHLAKGLEFDNVFVAGASEGLLPHAMSLDNNLRLEEERRLMYVAMTRARKKLYLSFYDIPSRFLGEIPEEFIETETQPGNFNGGDGADYEEEAVDLNC